MTKGQIGVLCGGMALALALGLTLDASPSDAFQLVGLAAGGALVAGVSGGGLLALLRNRSVRTQVVVVALTSVVAMAAGSTAASATMFISSHDFRALMVMLVSAGTMGILSATVLGDRIVRASRSLGELARTLGDNPRDRPAVLLPTEELETLARQLEATSDRLDEARRRERALDASRRELVAWVSHDLRTPLAGIRAMVEALEDQVVSDPESVARYYRTMRSEADRLAELVDDLFELSRINAGALQLHLEKVQLGDLLSDALAGAAGVARAKGVALVGGLNGADPEVQLSTPEVLRVLRNLLDNAIRHTPSDGSVRVEGGLAGDAAYVRVSDTCGGIPDDDLDRVFDLAFRGDGARTPADDGGGGLGLAIARGIVEAHHGDIAVANEGGGCRFTVRLPLEQPR